MILSYIEKLNDGRYMSALSSYIWDDPDQFRCPEFGKFQISQQNNAPCKISLQIFWSQKSCQMKGNWVLKKGVS